MYIVADIGGTKTRIGRSRDLGSFDDPLIYDSVPEYENGIATFIEQVRRVADGEAIEHMAIALPGTPAKDHRSSFISGTCTLSAWSNASVAHRLETDLQTKVVMENDTAMVGLGEAVFGAGTGAPIVAYITISTGVGGVRIVDQQIDRVARGSEIGGQFLSIEPRQTLEELVSGTAVRAKYGVHPRDLGKDSPVWEDLARTLAFGLYNSLLHWSPNRVVIGGSMLNEVGISVGRVRAHLIDINVKMPEIPEMVHSGLGDVGGLWGGLARLKQLA